MTRCRAELGRAALVAAAIAVAAGALTPMVVARSADAPDRHLHIETPGELTPEEASRAYGLVAPTMARGYALSAYVAARRYQNWRRHNTVPYLSATHGNRYVNNYANRFAEDYGHLEDGVRLAEGAILAKDSFTVTDDGDILPAPLFIMEKLAPQTSPETGDWRYVMVLPDSTVFGDSRGASSQRVAFCHACHAAGAADTDYLFHVPEEFRVDAHGRRDAGGLRLWTALVTGGIE